MMTEDEAKTKWCPFVRETELRTGTWNRPGDRSRSDAERYNCCGSACMAWRWALSPDKAAHFNKTWKTKGEPEAYPVGYCGLAGKP